MKLVFNKSSGAMVMSPDSDRLAAPVVTGVRNSLSSVLFHISPYRYFSEVLASVMILIRNSLLKFVKILNYNNNSKLQYPVDPENSLHIMSAPAHHTYTLSDGSFREIKHNVS